MIVAVLDTVGRFWPRAMTFDKLAKLILPRPLPGTFFAERERRTIAAVAEVMLTASPVQATPAEVVKTVEDFLIEGRSKRAWRIRLLVNIVEFAPTLMLLRPPFSRLSFAERERLLLEKFGANGRVFTLCGKIRHVVYVGTYGGAKGERGTGYIPVNERDRFRNKPAAPIEISLHKPTNGTNGSNGKGSLPILAATAQAKARP